MNGNKKSLWWKRVLIWILLTVLTIIVTSSVTLTYSHYIYPIWAKVTSVLTGKRCCYKVIDPQQVDTFAKQMTKLIQNGYIITVSPEASKMKIAPGKYDCKKTYFEVTTNILNRNSSNLRYILTPSKKVIHISKAIN